MPLNRIVGLLLAGVLGACAGGGARQDPLPAPPLQPVFDSLIVPGQRVGPVSLGMSGAQLLQAVGSPTRSNHIGDVTAVSFSNGISANVRDSDNRVTTASTSDERYSTPGGVHSGISEFEVRTRLGSPAGVLDDATTDRYLCYPGMWFGITRGTNRVNMITVTAGTACTSGRK